MLYVNGKDYRMTDDEKKALRKKFSFPLKLVYPPELVKESSVNRLPDQPTSINIPLRAVFTNKDGETEEWRWCRSVNLDAAGRRRYVPRNLPFMGSANITETNLELLYFLYYKSPHCKNGAIDPKFKKRAYFMIQDLVVMATEKVSAKATLARYDVLLNDNEIGLPEDQLRAIAKAYFIPNVDKLHINQIRVAIDLSVKRDSKNGIANFFELSKSDEFLTVRGKLQTAIDLKIIYFYARERLWRWAVEEGEKPENICKVLAKTLPENALISWYQANKDFKERLDRELEGYGAMEPVGKGIEKESGAAEA